MYKQKVMSQMDLNHNQLRASAIELETILMCASKSTLQQAQAAPVYEPALVGNNQKYQNNYRGHSNNYQGNQSNSYRGNSNNQNWK